MKEFKKLYGNNDRIRALKDFRNGVLIYCAIALLFAAFCIAFVVLYVKIELSVYLCFALNFIATVAFCWFSVIFFTSVISKKRALLRFFKAFENAEITLARGKFDGVTGEVLQEKTSFISLEFSTGDKKDEFFVLKGTAVPFKAGKIYDLQTLGSHITAYKEAEND